MATSVPASAGPRDPETGASTNRARWTMPVRIGAVEPEAALLVERQQPGFAQHLEMFGNAGQRQVGKLGQLAGGASLGAAGLDEAAPLGMGEGAQDFIDVGRVRDDLNLR